MVETDLVILGSGVGGISASIYALRYKVPHVLIGNQPGGTCMIANMIENWPGSPSISGFDLAQNFQNHVKALGGALLEEHIQSIQKDEDRFVVTTNKDVYKAKSIIYTLGTMHRHLDIPGEKEFEGRGVSYCATCDGAFFKEKTIAVVGGGDSAATGVLVLANLAKKVYMVYRGTSLRAEPAHVEQIKSLQNVEILFQTNIREIKGNIKVVSIDIDKEYQGVTSLPVDGVFIEIGQDPNSYLAQQIGVDIDGAGYIKVKEDMSTNIPGFFAAGDVTTGSAGFRQLLTAASEGIIATYTMYKYLKKKK